LDLGAAIELLWWERCGIRDHIAAGLPCFADALKELATRAGKEPQEFADQQITSLSDRVLQFWMVNFSQNGLETLGTDILIRGMEEDEFAQLIADFVWQNRDCLAN
jgi:hypothetical protein